jgi:hypothetical protein
LYVEEFGGTTVEAHALSFIEFSFTILSWYAFLQACFGESAFGVNVALGEE